ncbi:MAG: hypothetical protein QNJ56_06370 [Gammaproteobacteria bacterium]|nr:hypothetical protein [Gammaproteobacteria bacterium]
MKNKQMNRVVDSICHRGCRYVNTLLMDVDARRSCQELQDLNADQQIGVLRELKSVMAVYNKTGNCKL